MKISLDGIPQGIVLLIIGGLLSFAGQKWVSSDLEYKNTFSDRPTSAIAIILLEDRTDDKERLRV
jgi:uncharacterized membrane protein